MSKDRDEYSLRDPELDPYAPPKEAIGEGSLLEGSEDFARAEAIRRSHINHEASVKSLGHLHYLAVILMFLGLVPTVVQMSSMPQPEGGMQTARIVGFIVYFVVVISINLVMGVGLTGLKTWARWVEVALTVLSLLYFLLAAAGVALLANRAALGGTTAIGLGLLFMSIIPMYILYLLLSKKGSMVFSTEYREIIAATPHIKYKTSWIVKGCLIVFVVLIVLSIVALILAPRR
jgi:hypothetical protein